MHCITCNTLFVRSKCILEDHRSRDNAWSHSMIVQYLLTILNCSLDWLPTATAPLFQRALYLLSHRHSSEAKKHVCMQGFHRGGGGGEGGTWTHVGRVAIAHGRLDALLAAFALQGKGLVQESKILCHHLYFKPISFPCISGFLVFGFLKGLGTSSFRRRTGERGRNG